METKKQDMKKVLNGIVDLHVHAGPSVAKRKVDAAEMAQAAMEYGYSAFVIKDHYFPTTFSASLCETHITGGKVKVFGGIALNNSVGGLNVKAVDAAYNMGAKFVYMPTVSSRCHIDSHKGQHFPGAAASEGVPEVAMKYIDGNGNLKPSVIQILEYIAKRPELILATGHGTKEEIDALIAEAVKMGIEKIYVNHPFYMINADLAMMEKWAALGAIIEINACVFLFGAHPTPMSIAKEIFEKIALDKIVISSDLGQINNSHPAEGLYDFIVKLKEECGITQEQIRAATITNPKRLLEI